MRPRCETIGCRGNKPCEACIVEISVALEEGLVGGFSTIMSTSREKPQDTIVLRLVARLVMKSIAKELKKNVWSRSIVGKVEGHGRSSKEAREDRAPLAGRTRKRVRRKRA